jgi:predicted DNA repair protein MutK
MSGLLALLDDVAAIAKVAAASIDDVASQAAKAGAKAAGAVIDDAAVTPKYIHGFEADRELPIIWKITKGSIFNKLVILLPAALILSAFAPWAINPLLMIGGAYLCFEGAEKVWHMFWHPAHPEVPLDEEVREAEHLEQEKIAGAIKTDFILSAEIMTIILAATPESSIWFEAATLAGAGLGITALVYGGVALIVKADDFGLFLSTKGRFGATRALGRAIVRGMPGFLRALTAVGTAAMIWVGGSIIVHGLAGFGLHGPEHFIKRWADLAAHAVPEWGTGFTNWSVTAAMDGVLGLAIGITLIPVAAKIIAPLTEMVRGDRAA